MASILRTNGLVEDIEPKNGNDFSLDELRAIVEGYIEVVSLNNGFILVLNEEGKLQGLPFNEVATNVLVRYRGAGDYIVGTALLCRKEEVK